MIQNEANVNKSILKVKLEIAIQKLKHKHKTNTKIIRRLWQKYLQQMQDTTVHKDLKKLSDSAAVHLLRRLITTCINNLVVAIFNYHYK